MLSFGLLVAAPVCAQGATSPRPAATGGDAAAAVPPAGDLRALDNQVQAILDETRRQQELLSSQQARLDRAEAANAWLPFFMAGLVGLAGLAGWLGWRLRRQQRAQPTTAAPAAAVPEANAEMTPVDMAALVAAAMPDSTPARVAPRAPLPMQATARRAAAPVAVPAAAPVAMPAPAPVRMARSAPTPDPNPGPNPGPKPSANPSAGAGQRCFTAHDATAA